MRGVRASWRGAPFRARMKTFTLFAAWTAVVAVCPSAAQGVTVSGGVALEPTAAEQAQTLFKSGVSRYQMSDYSAAIEKFSQAFEFSAEIEDRELRARVLHALQFNLARAHVKSYGIDKELSHLRTALDLLDKYLVDEDLGTDDEARVLADEVRQELTTREEEARALAASGANAGSDAAVEGSTEATPAVESAGDDGGPTDRDASGEGKALTLGGYTSLGLGVASLGLMVGGMVMASKANGAYVDAGTLNDVDAERARGQLGNTLAIVGGIGAGVFLAAGVGMVIMGRKQKARASQLSTLRWSPVWSSRHLGFNLKGRF